MFRFIHSSDLHLGRRFGNLPEDTRGRLAEARHGALARLADAARAQGAANVLIAGDIFDSETPTDPVWRQALSAMAGDPALSWWLLPGNHDSLAAESLWDRVIRNAAPNIHVLTGDAPVPLAPGAVLLPAPATRRYPGRDLTAHMPDLATAAGDLRIGLAHGAVTDFGEEGGAGVIPPDRDRSARLDYLALGDWHGQMAIGSRCHYSGTPERDRFKHPGRGACLAVALPGPGAPPQVESVETGTFDWAQIALPLLPGQPADAALAALLPATGRRDVLLRIDATGRARLPQQQALREAAARVAPEFCHFELRTGALGTEYDQADLDQIDRGGALRLAATALLDEAMDPGLASAERDIAAAALNRLYAYAKEAER